MARITVSLPNDLDQRLQAYAGQKGQPVSHVVAQALQAFLDGTRTAGSPATDLEAREYLDELHGDLAQLRKAVEDMAEIVRPAHRVPARLPKPRWRSK